jgi:hypothetical protein
MRGESEADTAIGEVIERLVEWEQARTAGAA